MAPIVVRRQGERVSLVAAETGFTVTDMAPADAIKLAADLRALAMALIDGAAHPPSPRRPGWPAAAGAGEP